MIQLFHLFLFFCYYVMYTRHYLLIKMKVSYKKSEEVRGKLIDTAEALFAQKGFFGVSIRDITKVAGIRSASINYHFDSKQNLFMAVVNRRVETLAAARLDALSCVDLNSPDAMQSVREITQAFINPMIHFATNGDAGWKNYFTLIAHLGVQKIWVDNTVSGKYDDHALKFIEALSTVFPNATEYQIHCSYQFLLGTTLYAVCDNKRIDTLSKGEFRSDDLNKMKENLFQFVTNGILGTVK